MSFVHLHVRSEFSLVDSIVRISDLIAHTKTTQMPSVAMTDFMNIYGLVKFYSDAQKKGIKPIFGADVMIKRQDRIAQVTFLVLNYVGYLNLIKIISIAYVEETLERGRVVDWDFIKEHHEGLIVLLGKQSDIGQILLANDPSQAIPYLQDWQTLFSQRVYLELVRVGRERDEDFVHLAVDLAQKLQCPVVATNDVRFLRHEDFEAHEVRVCIGNKDILADSKRPKIYSPEQYLKSPEQMQELFADIPSALENSVLIAQRCNLTLDLGKPQLPDYPVPEGMTIAQFFAEHSHKSLLKRLDKILDNNSPNYETDKKRYQERLDFELKIINLMGFAGYFLIVMDFIQWAKQNGVPVGPGRGSGAGSLVAYALEITDLDPLPYDLLFERFLNPERVSMPDFDIDFCMDGRDSVIEYVAHRYGREAVAQIITFGTMAAKAVIRDVARVQGKSYGLANRLSKLIPTKPGTTLEDALKEEPELNALLTNPEDRDHESAKEIWEMAICLEGITRNVGKHAAGILIAPSKLTDFTAIYCDEEKNWVSQYDKGDVEKVGLVKFDFLGLRNLTIIDWAVKDINKKRQEKGLESIDLNVISLTDAASYKLLQEGKSTAVFQLESSGMKKLLRKLKPSNFEDLIALVALYRPGPLESGMVDDFINRKHGRAQVAYPDAQYQHECLKPILEPTYGVIVYQEQVMQIAQSMAGYSLGGADLLRRAMGKKDAGEMAKQRSLFMDGAKAKSIDAELAGHIFDLMEKFAGYGFNKSHSAGYALLAYQTAWLKTHFPAEFMAAVLTSEMHNTDNIVPLVEECRVMRLVIEPPHVNYSEFKFITRDNGNIVYGLGAVKGVGEGPVENIIAVRTESGPFKDLFDFCSRVDLRKCNKRTLEALIRSGAMDGFGAHRSALMASLENAISAAEQNNSNSEMGMADLFGDVVQQAPEFQFADAEPWTEKERLLIERDTLGLYLTGHPIDQYEKEINSFLDVRLSDIQPTRRGVTTLLTGIVMSVDIQRGMRGTSAFVTLDDRTNRVRVGFFGDNYVNYFADAENDKKILESKKRDLLLDKDALNHRRGLIKKDALLFIEGEVSIDQYAEGDLKVSAKKVFDLADFRSDRCRFLELRIEHSLTDAQFEDLKNTLQLHRALPQQGTAVRVRFSHPIAEAQLRLGEQWRLRVSDECLESLARILGKTGVDLIYHQ